MFSDSFQESNSSHPYFLLDYDCIHLERKSLFQTVHVFTEALAIVFEECFTLQIQGATFYLEGNQGWSECP